MAEVLCQARLSVLSVFSKLLATHLVCARLQLHPKGLSCCLSNFDKLLRVCCSCLCGRALGLGLGSLHMEHAPQMSG